MALKLPTRTTAVAARNAPRLSVPVVSRDEVDIAVQLVVGLYEPLQAHGQILFDFSVATRRNAYAIVQIAWAMAKVELEAGSREWYFKAWLPEMKAAKDGTQLDAKTPEGRSVKLGCPTGRRDRNLRRSSTPTQESRRCCARSSGSTAGDRTSLRS